MKKILLYCLLIVLLTAAQTKEPTETICEVVVKSYVNPTQYVSQSSYYTLNGTSKKFNVVNFFIVDTLHLKVGDILQCHIWPTKNQPFNYSYTTIIQNGIVVAEQKTTASTPIMYIVK